MKINLTEDVKKHLNSVNILMLLSCITFAVSEFLFMIPSYIYLKVNIAEFLELFLFEAGFYLMYFVGMLVIFDVIILLSAFTQKKSFFIILYFCFSSLYLISFHFI